MEISEFNPYVRFFQLVSVPISYPQRVLAYDHRLFYLRKGSLAVELERERFALDAGGLLVLPPAVEYRLCYGSKSVEYAIINFDFSYDHDEREARAPVCAKLFCRDEVFSNTSLAPFEKPVFLNRAMLLNQTIEEMAKVSTAEHAYRGWLLSALLKYLLLSVMRALDTDRTTEDELIVKIKDYVHTHLNSKINNASIAREMGYHPNYLNSRFAKSGTTLHAYLEEARLKRARELLLSTALPISNVAEECGFSEASYFSKFFLRRTGMLPKSYRALSQ